jgi:hypothetical protein
MAIPENVAMDASHKVRFCDAAGLGLCGDLLK